MIILDYVSDSDKIQDGMLLWLEEHGHRLQRGFIKLIEEGRAKSINLFPEEPPLCSTAVTNGVQVGEYILPLMFALLSLFIQA
jgi:F-box protein 3